MSIVILVLVLGSLIIAPRALQLIDSQRVENFRLGSERMFREAKSLAVSRRQDLEMAWEDGLVIRTSAAASSDASQPTTLASQSEEASTEDQETLDRLEAPGALVTLERGFINGQDRQSEEWALAFPSTGRGETGGAEFSASGRLFWVKIDAQGRITSGEGELTDEGPAEWEAGELEQRLQADAP
jgi:hypothetical protein